MSISTSNVSNVDFAKKDAETIVAEMIASFENETKRTLYPGDPLRLLILTFANYIVMQRVSIDFAGKQNLLEYATKGYIENIAKLFGVSKSEATSAVTTVNFQLSEPQPSAITIPKGTRVTSGNKIYFATQKDAIIPLGELDVQVKAECTQTGVLGNNFCPGEINELSDYLPYIAAVQNVTISQGGADTESVESLRQRTREAPESYAAAGPQGAYVFWAKTASQLIVDVSVTSPSPGVVEIIPLLENVPLLPNGQAATEEILQKIYAECNDDNRRPLTDNVVVRSPETAEYRIDLTYFISRNDAPIGLSIQKKVDLAIDEYILWQKSKLGRDINPSKLTEMIMGTGAKRVEIRSPTFKKTKYCEISIANQDMNIVYGGLEDD